MTAVPTVEDPIINSAFEEPRFHWLIEKGQTPTQQPGRRPAGYFFRVPEGAARGKAKAAPKRRKSKQPDAQTEVFETDSPGEWEELQAANQIREKLKAWRARGYDGATTITKELLALWHGDAETRRERLFFAQREAAEALIFMVEAPKDWVGTIPKLILPDEPGPAAKAQGYRAFQRYALKMATGTGKTTVMAMLAAWSILNALNRKDEDDDRFSDTVLIVCPNVTIRDRLQELDPAQGEQSLYAKRQLVPTRWLADLCRGDVIVTNWHNLALTEPRDVNGQRANVVKRGVPVVKTLTKTLDGKKVEIEETHYVESDKAFVNRILDSRKGRSPSILVLNDEAHHAYRRNVPKAEEVALDKEQAERNDREATIWIEGLDRLNKVLNKRKNGIRWCVDLSATPFFIQGSGNEVGKAFPWIISDFGLLDAIEAGMVKIPMLPSADTTGNGRPAYFNIWRWVQEQLEGDRLSVGSGQLAVEDGESPNHRRPSTGRLSSDNWQRITDNYPAHHVLRYAVQPISLLSQQWEEKRREWAEDFAHGKRKTPAPPVFIIVCRDTTLAKEVYAWLAEGKADYGPAPACFRNTPGKPVTVRIDSKIAEDIDSGSGSDEARRLRFVLETIGKTAWPGGLVPPEYAAIVAKHNAKAEEDDSGLPYIDPAIPPGRDIHCIISVAMLSEGWDATTVTHVIGMRPFGSQLLCEQVVGRALRRTHYSEDERGLLISEDAEVLGVPFELIPLKTSSSRTGTVKPKEINHVFPVDGKEEFAINFPVVEGYDDPGYVGVKIDWEKVPTLELDPLKVPDSVLVRAMVSHDGDLLPFGPGKAETFDLSEWRAGVREQQVAFQIAEVATKRILDEYGGTVPAHRLFPQLLGYARWLLENRVKPIGHRQRVDVALNPYFDRAVEALCGALVTISRDRAETERARIPKGPAGVRSTAEVDFHTTRPVWGEVSRCHLNLCAMDTKQWEQSAAYYLDTHPKVKAWVKNDHLGLFIRYRLAGRPHNYVPDFIVCLVNGRMLIIEVKGELGNAEIKQAAALRWVSAVNREKSYGEWSYHLVRHPADVTALLDEMGGFERVAQAKICA